MMFSWYGKALLAILSRLQIAKMYCSTLDQYSVPSTAIYPQQKLYFEFQQNNATTHPALISKNWLQFSFARSMMMPARSLDLNPIEKLWVYMVQDVFRDCCPYSTVSNLKCAALTVWENLSVEACR